MSDGTPGAKGNPTFLGGGAPSIAGDSNEISAWAAANIDASVPTFTDLNSLPFTWLGMRRTVLSESADYVLRAGGWKRVIDDTGWIALPLAGNWVDYAGGYAPASYRRLNGLVIVRGLIKDGAAAANSLLGTLPAGFRPSSSIIRPIAFNGGVGNATVGPTGGIFASSAVSASFTSIDMPPFMAEL